MSVACINVNGKNAGCLIFLKANVEVEKRGERGKKKKEKDKISNSEHLSSCVTSSDYFTLYSANYMFI